MKLINKEKYNKSKNKMCGSIQNYGICTLKKTNRIVTKA